MTLHRDGGRGARRPSKGPSVLSIVLALGKRTRKQARALREEGRVDSSRDLGEAKVWCWGPTLLLHTIPTTREKGVVEVKY